MIYVFFFFFKQKTAYEMRISDWSSDVCSSDLSRARQRFRAARPVGRADRRRGRAQGRGRRSQIRNAVARRRHRIGQDRSLYGSDRRRDRRGSAGARAARSEEHTSELQSLMRISYAVFCLKKKKQYSHTQITYIARARN